MYEDGVQFWKYMKLNFMSSLVKTYALKYIVTALLGSAAVYVAIKLPLSNGETILILTVIALIIIYMYVDKKIQYMIQLSFLWGILYAPIIIWLRGYVSRNHAILIGFPAIVSFTWALAYAYRKKLSAKNILVASLMTLLLMEGPIRLINFSSTLTSLPSFIFNIAGILIGNMLFIKRGKVAWLSFSIVFGCAVWMFCEGGSMWANRVSYGTYTGKINIPAGDNYKLYDEKGDVLSLSKMDGKIVLLDFWCDGCGACWRKFPVIQNLYDTHRMNSNVFIAGVFVESKKGEYENNMNKFHKKYTFPVFRVSKGDALVTELSIKHFPTVAVMDANGVFRGLGSAEVAMNIFDDLVKDSFRNRLRLVM